MHMLQKKILHVICTQLRVYPQYKLYDAKIAKTVVSYLPLCDVVLTDGRCSCERLHRRCRRRGREVGSTRESRLADPWRWTHSPTKSCHSRRPKLHRVGRHLQFSSQPRIKQCFQSRRQVRLGRGHGVWRAPSRFPRTQDRNRNRDSVTTLGVSTSTETREK